MKSAHQKIQAITGIMVILLVALFGRVAWIKAVHGDEYEQAAQQQQVMQTDTKIPALRGTIVDSKGNPMREGPILDRLTVRLKDSICHSTRYSDIINQYGPGQYLVLLTNPTMENCEVVESRINERFLSQRQRTGVVYHVKAVEGLVDDGE